MTTGTLNPRLQEFSEALPPLPGRYAGHRDLLERVPECQTPLFLAVEVDGGGTVHLFFDAPPESRPPAASPASSTRPLMGSTRMRSWRHRASSPANWGWP